MTFNTGDPAPDFDLESDAGKRLSLRDFEGKWLIVYFYPKDNTPGCTREAQDFSSAAARLQKRGAYIVGVSKDSVKTHCGFRDKVGVRFPLLSDPTLDMHKAYGAWGLKTMYGKKVEGTIRSTFLISPKGTVARAWNRVKVDGHVDAVDKALAEAQSEVQARGGSEPKGDATSQAKTSQAKTSQAKTSQAKKSQAKKSQAKKSQAKKSQAKKRPLES